MTDTLILHEYAASGNCYKIRTLADIALYAYTHIAEEGDLSLAPYAGVRAWLARVAAMPGYVGIGD